MLSPLPLHLVSLCWERSGLVLGSLAASYSSTCTKIPVPRRYCSELVLGLVSSSYDTFLFSCPRVRRARSSLVLKLISCNHQDKHRNREKKKKQEHELQPPHKKRKERKMVCKINTAQQAVREKVEILVKSHPAVPHFARPILRCPGQFFKICSKTRALHSHRF